MTDLDRDALILAITAFAESRGEGQIGIRAQIHSVINRHAAGKWYSRKTLAGTCFLSYAYSAYNEGDPNAVLAAETPVADPIMALCIKEAYDAMSGDSVDPTRGATHYHSDNIPLPNWVTGIKNGVRVSPPAEYTCKIGHHLFYRGVQ